MTHDTPGEADESRRWCEHCQLAVDPDPESGDSGAQCPACGRDL